MILADRPRWRVKEGKIMDAKITEIIFRTIDTFKQAIESGRGVSITADDITIGSDETVINNLSITVDGE